MKRRPAPGRRPSSPASRPVWPRVVRLWQRRTTLAQLHAQRHPTLDAWSRLAVVAWIVGMVAVLVPWWPDRPQVFAVGSVVLAGAAMLLIVLAPISAVVRRRDRAAGVRR